jgi:hypothetical protein
MLSKVTKKIFTKLIKSQKLSFSFTSKSFSTTENKGTTENNESEKKVGYIRDHEKNPNPTFNADWEPDYSKYPNEYFAIPSAFERTVGMERLEILDPHYFDELLVTFLFKKLASCSRYFTRSWLKLFEPGNCSMF